MQSNVIAEVSALMACSIILLLLVGAFALFCGVAEYLCTALRDVEQLPTSPPTEEGMRKEKRDNGRLIAMLGVFMLVIAFCLTFDAFH